METVVAAVLLLSKPAYGQVNAPGLHNCPPRPCVYLDLLLALLPVELAGCELEPTWACTKGELASHRHTPEPGQPLCSLPAWFWSIDCQATLSPCGSLSLEQMLTRHATL